MPSQATGAEAPHPIADLVFEILVPGPRGEFLLPPQGEEKLRHALESLVKTGELKTAVMTLARIARFLDQDRNSKKAAEAILEITEEALEKR